VFIFAVASQSLNDVVFFTPVAVPKVVVFAGGHAILSVETILLLRSRAISERFSKKNEQLLFLDLVVESATPILGVFRNCFQNYECVLLICICCLFVNVNLLLMCVCVCVCVLLICE